MQLGRRRDAVVRQGADRFIAGQGMARPNAGHDFIPCMSEFVTETVLLHLSANHAAALHVFTGVFPCMWRVQPVQQSLDHILLGNTKTGSVSKSTDVLFSLQELSIRCCRSENAGHACFIVTTGPMDLTVGCACGHCTQKSTACALFPPRSRHIPTSSGGRRSRVPHARAGSGRVDHARRRSRPAPRRRYRCRWRARAGKASWAPHPPRPSRAEVAKKLQLQHACARISRMPGW